MTLSPRLVEPRIAAEHAVRLLMDARCNLACVFCHNEFQGQEQAGGRFDVSRVLDLLEEAAKTADAVSVKFSGGEPLLRRKEIRRLLPSLVEHPAVTKAVLISNLQIPLSDDERAFMVDHRLAEVRVNIPSSDPELYRRRAGGRGSLRRALGHATAFAELGVRVDATCVLDEQEVDSFLDRVEQEKRRLGVVPDHVVHPGILEGWGC